MDEKLRTCHFSAIAQLATEEEAQPPAETIERVLADTQWTEVQLAVLEFHEQEHFVLVADAIPRPSSHSDWGEVDAPARVLNHFSTSWSIAAYTETKQYIHWHGGRGLGDVKVLFKSDGHTREFLRAFVYGWARAEEIANQNAQQLTARRYAILNALDRLNATALSEGRETRAA